MRFVETPVFTAAVQGLLADEEYRALQSALLLRPEQGAVIPGSGGLRKLRWAGRGGARIIYYWFVSEEVIYMLFAYSKSAAANLTPAQVKVLRRLVKEAFE